MSDRITTVLNILDQEVKSYEVPVVDLIRIQTNDPFKILVATMLSARTKDEVTAVVCKRLFKIAPNPKTTLSLDLNRLEELLYGVAFYKTKTKNLIALCTSLLENFNGQVPPTIDELLSLPGVGRKTANLVVAQTKTQGGICVDTHVHRILNRLDYIRTSTPQETEWRLRKKLPKQHWDSINRILVAFGQHLCRPISPHCSTCPIKQHCRQRGITHSR